MTVSRADVPRALQGGGGGKVAGPFGQRGLRDVRLLHDVGELVGDLVLEEAGALRTLFRLQVELDFEKVLLTACQLRKVYLETTEEFFLVEGDFLLPLSS